MELLTGRTKLRFSLNIHSLVIVIALFVTIDSSSDEEITDLEQPLFLDKIVEGLEKIKEDLTGSPDIGTISFLLFHPSKPKNKQWETIGTGNSSKIVTTGLKSGKPFKIAIHGFLQSCITSSSDFPESIFKAYATKKNNEYNLICIDWKKLANPGKIAQVVSLFHYPKAVNNTLVVGDTTAKFIESLISAKILKSKKIIDVHLIGHSLGAHICGVAGHEFTFRSKNKVARISGLDPAGPSFYEKGKADKCKLGTSDAEFVDVLHTNMGQLGTNEMLGHVNFIPNGGIYQPFCKQKTVLEDLAEKVSGVCSHAASNSMFAKSIKENLKACKCKNWDDFQKLNGSCKANQVTYLGDNVSLKSKGNFCLRLKSL